MDDFKRSMVAMFAEIDSFFEQLQKNILSIHDGDNRLKKVEIPKFYGDNVEEWLDECEDFFSVDETPENYKVRYAAFYVEGRALSWHVAYVESSGKEMKDIPWAEYKSSILFHFGEMKQSKDMKKGTDLSFLSCDFTDVVADTNEIEVSSEIVNSAYQVFDEIPERLNDEFGEVIGIKISASYEIENLISEIHENVTPALKIDSDDLQEYNEFFRIGRIQDTIIDKVSDNEHLELKHAWVIDIKDSMCVKDNAIVESAMDLLCDFWGQKSFKVGVLGTTISSFEWKPGWVNCVRYTNEIHVDSFLKTAMKSGVNGVDHLSRCLGSENIKAAVVYGKSCRGLFEIPDLNQQIGMNHLHKDSYGRVAANNLSGDTTLGWNDYMKTYVVQQGFNRVKLDVLKELESVKSERVSLIETVWGSTIAVDGLRYVWNTKIAEFTDLAVEENIGSHLLTRGAVVLVTSKLLQGVIRKRSGSWLSISRKAQFGVGSLSVYLVAEKVIMTAKHNDDGQYIWKFQVDGSLIKTEQLGRGIKNLLKKQSEFISYPISLWTKKRTKEISDDEEKGNEVGNSCVISVTALAAPFPSVTVTFVREGNHHITGVPIVTLRIQSGSTEIINVSAIMVAVSFSIHDAAVLDQLQVLIRGGINIAIEFDLILTVLATYSPVVKGTLITYIALTIPSIALPSATVKPKKKTTESRSCPPIECAHLWGTSLVPSMKVFNELVLSDIAKGLVQELVSSVEAKSLLYQLDKNVLLCMKPKISLVHARVSANQLSILGIHWNLKLHSKEIMRLELADLGLTRAFTLPVKKYSKEILTIWYMAPDVFLGIQGTDVVLKQRSVKKVEISEGLMPYEIATVLHQHKVMEDLTIVVVRFYHKKGSFQMICRNILWNDIKIMSFAESFHPELLMVQKTKLLVLETLLLWKELLVFRGTNTSTVLGILGQLKLNGQLTCGISLEFMF